MNLYASNVLLLHTWIMVIELSLRAPLSRSTLRGVISTEELLRVSARPWFTGWASSATRYFSSARRCSGDFAILYLPHYAKSCKHDYLTHTCLAWTLYPLSIAPSIVAVDLQAPLHRLHLVSLKRLCRLVDIRERIIASGAPFRSRDHPDIYLDMHLYSMVQQRRDNKHAWTIPRLALIFVKKSLNACGWTVDAQPPQILPQSFFHQFIYSTNYREDYLPCHRV